MESKLIQISCQNTSPKSNYTDQTGLTALGNRSDQSAWGAGLPEVVSPSSEVQIGGSIYESRSTQ